MRIENKILHKVNLCLQQKSNTNFKLNSSEAYAGLSDLYEHYALENKTDQYFDAIALLCDIPDEYQFGDNPVLDNFIIQLEKVYHPKKAEKLIEDHPTPWWKIERDRLLALAETHSPCYVYHSPTIGDKAKQLLALKSIDILFYAMKANSHPEILKTLETRGVNFECVSIQEINRVLALFPSIDRKRILFTPNFAPKAEYQYALNIGCYVTIDSIYPLEHWPELFKNQHIILRIDPGVGAGHHKHVLTGGNESKFGINQNDIEQAVVLTKKNNVKVIGLHSHSGSGILTPDLWEQTTLMLLSLISKFPHIQLINIGGGLGVIDKQEQHPLDFAKLDAGILAIKSHYPHVKLWMEPGRFFVAESGIILAKITQCKEKGELRFIGIETGMNSLIRPSLYGAYHEIVNLSRLYAEATEFAHVVGPICESGDTLGYDRLLPQSQEGDIILIANTGAYGHCMSSNYNLRPPAQEIVLE